MKITLIVATLLFAYAAGEQCLMATMQTACEECLKKLGSMKGACMTNEETNRIELCIMENAGLMRNGTMNLKRMQELLGSCSMPNVVGPIINNIHALRRCNNQQTDVYDGTYGETNDAGETIIYENSSAMTRGIPGSIGAKTE